ncbi:MAG: indole-3-glycerol phosphate synthase TrpC [Solirubrobacteraceae bacterium]|nr:MAG: indole-3-glycerol phosphate synthase TrpC [Solirubrobacterales bacterium]
MTGVLARIVAATREEVARRRSAVPEAEIERAANSREDHRPFAAALVADPGVAVIAEYKRRSPSAGTIGESAPLDEVVAAYERGGAAALSILTEGPHFGGSLADLEHARSASALPLLRKDFIVDRYQLLESRAAGADAVLLIVGALDRGELASLYREALTGGLEVLVEVHDRPELALAAELGATLIGVNNRDLHDFSVDVGRTRQLLGEMPAGTVVVSESGFERRAQVEQLAELGVDAVLVGEALMRAPDTEAAVRGLAALGPRS